ncbi:MAG: hypothetical protein ACM3RR_00065 [Bacillota bacterium]
MIWYKDSEKRAARAVGGQPSHSIGPDGYKGSKPIEVKSRREDDRFRIGRDNHREMVNEHGTYVFNDNGRRETFTAGQVDRQLKREDREWYDDRREGGQNYKHTFLYPSDMKEMRKRKR